MKVEERVGADDDELGRVVLRGAYCSGPLNSNDHRVSRDGRECGADMPDVSLPHLSCAFAVICLMQQ